MIGATPSLNQCALKNVRRYDSQRMSLDLERPAAARALATWPALGWAGAFRFPRFQMPALPLRSRAWRPEPDNRGCRLQLAGMVPPRINFSLPLSALTPVATR